MKPAFKRLHAWMLLPFYKLFTKSESKQSSGGMSKRGTAPQMPSNHEMHRRTAAASLAVSPLPSQPRRRVNLRHLMPAVAPSLKSKYACREVRGVQEGFFLTAEHRAPLHGLQTWLVKRVCK